MKQTELRREAERLYSKQFVSGKGAGHAHGQAGDVIRELEIAQIELKLQNEELREYQARIEEEMARYHDLYDFAPVAYFTFDRKGMITEANRAAAEMLGIGARQLIGTPFFLYVAPPHRKLFHAHQHEIFQKGGRQRIELNLLNKDGTEFEAVMESRLEETSDRAQSRFRSIVTDISEYKALSRALQESNQLLEEKVSLRTAELLRSNAAMAEEIEAKKKAERGLKDLAAKLHEVRERERLELSREMHDDFGQDMVSIKMEASWICGHMDGSPSVLVRKAKSIVENTDKCIQKIKRIASSLRPPVLDDCGIAAAIEWQCREFEKRTGIRCFFINNTEKIALRGDAGINIFRIFQESLTNIARHAEATEVKTSLQVRDGKIILEVRDNGKGIGDDEAAHPGALGILGMKERAGLIGGGIEITRPPAGGTLVRFTLSPPRNLMGSSERQS